MFSFLLISITYILAHIEGIFLIQKAEIILTKNVCLMKRKLASKIEITYSVLELENATFSHSFYLGQFEVFRSRELKDQLKE